MCGIPFKLMRFLVNLNKIPVTLIGIFWVRSYFTRNLVNPIKHFIRVNFETE